MIGTFQTSHQLILKRNVRVLMTLHNHCLSISSNVTLPKDQITIKNYIEMTQNFMNSQNKHLGEKDMTFTTLSYKNLLLE